MTGRIAHFADSTVLIALRPAKVAVTESVFSQFERLTGDIEIIVAIIRRSKAVIGIFKVSKRAELACNVFLTIREIALGAAKLLPAAAFSIAVSALACAVLRFCTAGGCVAVFANTGLPVCIALLVTALTVLRI